MADAKMVRVRTGESSYIEFNEADAAEWRKTHREYGDTSPAPTAEEAPRDEDSIATRATDVPPSKKKAQG